MGVLQRLSELAVGATRAVLTNPWLLFGMMAAALLVELLLAPRNREE